MTTTSPCSSFITFVVVQFLVLLVLIPFTGIVTTSYQITNLISIFLTGHILFYYCIDSSAYFTQVPPSKMYVVEGGTARFVWDYHVDDRDKEFDFFSPKWLYYAGNGAATTIGGEVKPLNWTFIITMSCPSRLRRPVLRVNKESNATLVITNVTMADSGLYGCVLLLSSSMARPFSKVELVVTGKVAIGTRQTNVRAKITKQAEE